MQTLEQLTQSIQPLDQSAMQQAKARVDGLLKPIGSLGRLEMLVIQMAGIYRSPALEIGRKEIIVMAADHGVFDEGIAITPKEVTAIQAFNMTKGRGVTGVCALAYAAGVAVNIVDVGIDCDPIPGVLDMKVAEVAEISRKRRQ